MLDLIIKNALVLDGSGAPAFEADVAVSGDKIALVRKNIEQEAAAVINAAGLHLSPGFIDPHTHSDLTLLADPRAESKIRQGVTTEVIGNCGSSPAPLLGAARAEAEAEAQWIDLQVDWQDMAGYLARLQKQGSALNVAPLVGHTMVRGSVLGYENVQPQAKQQAQMERLVMDAMEQGARGLSSGLYYPPGFYAHTDEVIGLARASAEKGGIYTSHIRSESDGLFAAVEEAIEIGQKAESPVQISHLKLEGTHNFEGAERLLAIIDRARADGVQVSCDQYPYAASSTWLGAFLPNWAQAGGGKVVAQRLQDRTTRDELRADWRKNRRDWENRSGVTRWSEVLVTQAEGRRDAEGRTLAEIAGEEGRDPLDTLFDLIAVSQGGASAIFFDQLEENVQILMRHSLVMVSSDGSSLSPQGALGRGNPHPRSYGTFPRVLGRYVRELQTLKLEEAVHKMTGLTAQIFNLQGRGLVKEGAYADLTLFDAGRVIDRATFAAPKQFPDGISFVIVNGVVVISEGEHTGALPGRPL